jgi:hypothetical protein
MRFDKLKKRLSSLEVRSGVQDAQLHFADRSTRVVHMRDPLGCLIATWSKVHARLEGLPEPASPHDQTIALFGRAERVDADDSFLQLLHEETQRLAECELAPGAPDPGACDVNPHEATS